LAEKALELRALNKPPPTRAETREPSSVDPMPNRADGDPCELSYLFELEQIAVVRHWSTGIINNRGPSSQ
jgi:hypothetical protein